MSKCDKVLVVFPEWDDIVASVRLLPRQLNRTSHQFYAHIVGAVLTLLLIYFNLHINTIVPILSTLLYLLDYPYSIDNIITNGVSWLVMFTCAPIWLGQPITLETVKLNATLFVQAMGYGSLYKKQHNTAMGLLTLGCLSSSIALVLDWARWWQAYPIPMQVSLAITHLIVISFSAYY